MGFCISEFLIDNQKTPLGIDERTPMFSWKMEHELSAILQESYQIIVTESKSQKVVWDTNRQKDSNSLGVIYAGQTLRKQTRYEVTLIVRNNRKEEAKADSWFETGLMQNMNAGIENAEWITAEHEAVASDTRGVYILETEFCLKNGAERTGVVFGAGDERLQKSYLNEYGLAGENYIRYDISIEKEEAELLIYRVGYAKDDRSDVPFARVLLQDFEKKGPVLLHEKNRDDFHKIRIEVPGNQAYFFFDDVLVDAVETETMFGKQRFGRILNPRGHNDCITYPRLNGIGFFSGKKGETWFRYLKVRNHRVPAREFISEIPGNSIFDEQVMIKDGCFIVSNAQIVTKPDRYSVPMFRSAFYCDREIRQARLYITARGIYECKINGHEITERKLAPGLTQYDKRINYQTYDVTSFIEQRSNAIGVTAASGWWSDAQTFALKNYHYFGDRNAILVRLQIDYCDGTVQTVCSDTKHWKCFLEGPVTYSGLFLGEQIDSTKKEMEEGYSLAGFDDTAWDIPVPYKPVEIPAWRSLPPGFGREWPAVNKQEPVLEGTYDAPIHIIMEKKAVSVKQLEDSVYLYDFGQEMAGVVRVILHEKKGTKVTFRYAEMLYPESKESGINAGRPLYENYRDATSTDLYVCNGAEDIFQPKFTFHGYRYVEISGITRSPEPADVVSLQYSSDVSMSGEFQCSNGMLNRFVENVKWSQLCNFISIPTDCPQRNERMGWAGDTHVFCRTALCNSDLKAFYERNLTAMTDLMEEDGQFPEIAPIGGGFGGITYECAAVIMTWELYNKYKDRRTLQKFYPYLKRYMEYMKRKGLPGKEPDHKLGPLGDWLAREETDPVLMWNLFYYREANLMARMALTLGFENDEKEFTALAGRIKSFWQKTFLEKETGKTIDVHGKSCDTMTSYALSIVYGILDDEAAAGRHLLQKVKKSDFRIWTGFFGTGALCPALGKTGYMEEACRLLLQEQFPSWLYPVSQGATSIWERWDSYTTEKGFNGQNSMNSFNHYSLGSVLAWMYEGILGIQWKDDDAGDSTLLIRPYIAFDRKVSGKVHTPFGILSCGWEYNGSEGTYQCEIPVNLIVTLELPGTPELVIGSGKHSFSFSVNTSAKM